MIFLQIAIAQAETYISTLPLNAITGIGALVIAWSTGLLWAIFDETRDSFR